MKKKPRGRYVNYARQLVGVVAALGVLADLVLVFLFNQESVGRLLFQYPLLGLSLFAIPSIGGVFAASAQILSLREASGDPDSRGAQQVLTWFWLGTVITGVTAFLALLSFPRLFLSPLDVALIGPLLVSYSMVVTAFSSVLFGIRGRLVFLGVIAVLLATIPLRFGLFQGRDELISVLYTLCFNLPMLLGLSWILYRASALDSAREQYQEERALLLEERVRVAARKRTNELVHDSILSLLSATATHREITPVLQRSAVDAQDLLAGRNPELNLRRVSDLVAAIKSQYPGVNCAVSAGAPSFKLPRRVGLALHAAIEEAITNSLLHANTPLEPPTEVTVVFRFDGERLEARIHDDGCGFDPEESAHLGRFGMDRGIYMRMEEVGGQATVDSAIGQGTTVTLVWPAPKRTAKAPESAPEAAVWQGEVGRALDTKAAWRLALAIVLIHALIILLASDSFRAVWPSSVVLAVYTGLLFGFVLRKWPNGTMPLGAAAFVSVTVALGNFVVFASIRDSADLSTSAWTLGTGVFIACGLLLRGRFGAAWSTVALLLLSTSLWCVWTGQPLSLALLLVAGQGVTLLFWSLVVIWSSTALATLRASDRLRQETAAERLVHEEVRSRATELLQSVAKRSAPLISSILNGDELTDELRMHARLLEAELRDEIRAASFVGTPVVKAAREARERGLEVVLLDDHAPGNEPSEVPERFLELACGSLRRARSGRVVIRLQPAGSPSIGTILSEDESLVVSQTLPPLEVLGGSTAQTRARQSPTHSGEFVGLRSVAACTNAR